MIQLASLIIDKTKPPIKGVIHVGAHMGQEIPFYAQQLGLKDIRVYEPLPLVFPVLEANYGRLATCVNKAVGAENGETEMNVETVNGGQSSSILPSKEHSIKYPHITFDKKIKVEVVALDSDVPDKSLYDFLVIDVQGYELNVLKGAKELLSNIRLIYTEINLAEMYEGCARLNDLDIFLKPYGFTRILTQFEQPEWGNAFYLKNENS